MRNVIGPAVLLSLALPLVTPAHAAPAKWTILREVYWQISQTARMRAVGLYGSYASLQACQAANGGKSQTEAVTTDGRKVVQSCEIKLEGEF